MDKCPNCGNKINRMDVLCPRCGAVVEDVKVKSGVKIKQTEEPVFTAPAAPKKEFPQNFIVYNEDFPSDEEVVFGGDSSFKAEADYEDSEYSQSSTEASAYEDAGITEDYSERYLERIKDLPEIDDISTFDPEEYMKQYRLSRGMYGDVPSGTVPEKINFSEKVTKHYLEIEEIIPPQENTLTEEQPSEAVQFKTAETAELLPEVESYEFPETEYNSEAQYIPVIEEAQVEENEQSGNIQTEELKEEYEVQAEAVYQQDEVQSEAPFVERRYNPNAPHRYNNNKNTKHKSEPLKAVVEQEITARSARKKKKRVPAAAAILIWIAVIAGLFAGFWFFDQHVKTTYGDYGSFLNSITSGKIDIGKGK